MHVLSWYPSRLRSTFQGPIRTVKFIISFAPARVSSRSVGGIEFGYAANAETYYPIPSQFTTSPASPATRRRHELYKFALGNRKPKPLDRQERHNPKPEISAADSRGPYTPFRCRPSRRTFSKKRVRIPLPWVTQGRFLAHHTALVPGSSSSNHRCRKGGQTRTRLCQEQSAITLGRHGGSKRRQHCR
jgi:hypothetical protein